MFDKHGLDRLTEWKQFRNSLEVSPNPLKDLAEFWSQAPFVNDYLDKEDPNNWPDPWHLVLDQRLDDLAIALGMLYTLKLTQRFMDTKCEIHMSMLPNKSVGHLLLIEDRFVLNYRYREVIEVSDIPSLQTTKLYPISSSK